MDTGCHALWHPWVWRMARTPGVRQDTLEFSSLLGTGKGRTLVTSQAVSKACLILQSYLFVFRVRDPSKCPLFHYVLSTTIYSAQLGVLGGQGQHPGSGPGAGTRSIEDSRRVAWPRRPLRVALVPLPVLSAFCCLFYFFFFN